MPQEKRHIPDSIDNIVASIKHVLGNKIHAMYLFGSAVMGGLRPDSDLDFFVLVERSLTNDMRRALVTELMKVSGRKALDGPLRPVELIVVKESAVIPWRYPPEQDFQYGEWLRCEFEQGLVPQAVDSPDLAILISKARKSSVALVGQPANEVFDPIPTSDIHLAIQASLPALLNNLSGDERNVILTLARMWMTLATGEIVSKDRAASWVIERLPKAHKSVLDLARQAYLGEYQDDWQSLREQVVAFVHYAEKAIRLELAHL